ncbi:ATP-binding protein [Planktothrix agardhii]|uniref:ATP-binding protein n=1 Tax=Planktothrix agardhii TaxID=1160 RepID=UPI0028B031F1|nr:ATP-binding protein [Planktothrix agardhii]
MNVTEVLQFADQLFFEQTGKHLDDSQEIVIKGVWDGKTYEAIADESNRSERHVRDIGYKLWQILSERLGEDVHKSNFRSTLERMYIKSSEFFQNNCSILNFGSQTFSNTPKDHREKSTPNKNQSGSSYYDLILAPTILQFYNREPELEKLSNWIFDQNTRLISVLGLSGIGKSHLVRKFIDLNSDQFQVIIWRSLKYSEPLELLIDDILNIHEKEIKTNTNHKQKQLFEIFTEKRCLIILDDLQNIFMSGAFAGQYKPEYQDYQDFFKKIMTTEHHSHVIVISQEKCQDMESLDEELYPIKCLDLSGLSDVNILKNTGLKDEDHWSNLINLYDGNPFYLKTIANSIRSVFNGYVSDFLAENELIITKDIQTNLQLLFKGLSLIEQKIVIKLSNSEQFLSREELKTSLDLSSTDLINSLESLQNRYLLMKITEDKIMFILSPVFREYVRNCCKD